MAQQLLSRKVKLKNEQILTKKKKTHNTVEILKEICLEQSQIVLQASQEMHLGENSGIDGEGKSRLICGLKAVGWALAAC